MRNTLNSQTGKAYEEPDFFAKSLWSWRKCDSRASSAFRHASLRRSSSFNASRRSSPSSPRHPSSASLYSLTARLYAPSKSLHASQVHNMYALLSSCSKVSNCNDRCLQQESFHNSAHVVSLAGVLPELHIIQRACNY